MGYYLYFERCRYCLVDGISDFVGIEKKFILITIKRCLLIIVETYRRFVYGYGKEGEL